MISPTFLRCEYLINPLGIDIVNPRLSWILESEENDQLQTSYRIIVSSTQDKLNKDEGDIWDTKKIQMEQNIHIKYEGKKLESKKYYYWKVKVWDKDDNASDWSINAYWSMGLLESTDWKAHWIGAPPRKRKRPIRKMIPKMRYLPCPFLRRTFYITKKIKKAIIYSTALGEYMLYINGERVGDHLFAPEWTDYNKRIQYQTYDVSPLLQEGENVLGAILGDGWYRGCLGPFGLLHDYYGVDLRLLMQLYIAFEDNTEITIYTDKNWKITLDGPIRQADHFRGEIYDCKKELKGWNLPGFDDSAWDLVTVELSKSKLLRAQMNEPIKIIKELKAIEVSEPKSGIFIFNLGQNIAGWCKIRLNSKICKPNATVSLRHAEILKEDGTLYTANLRLTKSTDIYKLNNLKERDFHPHFTYHGFQYVEVKGLKKGVKPDLDIITGCVIASSSPIVGSFESSDKKLNKLWHNILWTQIDNMISVPTDCPQRNERMGWMGDNTAYCQTAIYNLDMAGFYSKWIKDIREAQHENGSYPDFVPYPRSKIYDKYLRFYCCPGWADCGIILPWTMYLNYADKKILEDHYGSAKQFIKYVYKRNPDLIWTKGIGNMYGDWLNGDEFKIKGYPKKGSRIPNDVYSTIYFLVSTQIVSKMANILGNDNDAEYFKDLAEKIKVTFNQSFVSVDGKVKGDNQASYAFPLYYDVIPKELRTKVIKNLIHTIKKLDYRISTGFMTTLPFMMVLAQTGNVDIAYKILFREEVPSWFYMIDQGATTMWERWDGNVKGRGPRSSLMNSFNHFAIGSVGEWIYRVILGINLDPESPGYKHFNIKPLPCYNLKWAKGSYKSVYGKISVHWRVEDGKFSLNVSIPANTKATIQLPNSEIKKINSGQYSFKINYSD
ncbi:MAG: glycoside hydrolase family 78 protein [Promethearchaeota archaeon]